MDIKISEDKVEKIIDTIVNGIGVDKYDSFQARTRNNISYVEFLTPRTREYVISRYYPELVLIVVNNEKLYDLVSVWVSSHKLYDIIKDEIIKRIYQKYTNRFTKRFPNDIWNIKYMSDEDFNKK